MFLTLFTTVILLTGVNAAAQVGTIAGTVTDAETGLPLEGVTVSARAVEETDGHGHGHGGPGGHHGCGDYAETGADGTYVMEEVEVGAYVLVARFQGYYVGDAEVEVLEGETTTADFALEELMFGALSGMVTDTATGLPLAGAMIRVRVAEPDKAKLGQLGLLGAGRRHWGGGCGQHYHATTGEDGTYFIDSVVADYYEVSASAMDYVPANPVGLFVMDGETAVADFALEAMTYGALEGYVTDADTGEPIEGARVNVRPDMDVLGHGHGGPGGGHGHGHHGATTDENGYFLLDPAPTGAHIGFAHARGYEHAEAPVTIVEGETAQLDFALTPWGE